MATGEWAFVALGSNLGDRSANLDLARTRLAELSHTSIAAESGVDETEPLGDIPQGKFLNQMLLIRTERSAHELLQAGLAAELEAGRTRSDRWAARTLDIDIVRFGDQVIRDPDLTVPHPELARRPFWLREMAELIPRSTEGSLPPWAQVRPQRQEHIERVAALVETWAIAMGRPAEERSRWVRAAFMHDALRDAPAEDVARWSEGKWGIPKLYHGPAAATVAKEHGEEDELVLDAIRYHSVGYPGWDDAGRMLFMADYLEPGRAFKRRQRAALAARVPLDPRGVLFNIVQRRLLWALKHSRSILPEGAAFWNDVVAWS